MVHDALVTIPAHPRVSVCIANYNGETLLSDCIDSVLEQDIDGGVEIIVHDDASSDGSLELLQRRYPQARILASQFNVGFCIANNRMATVAAGEYLLLLNNDAALHPDALGALLAEAEQIAVPAILTLPQYAWENGALVDRGCLLDPFHVPIPNRDPRRADVAYVIGACLWLPRTAWRELGGFPEWLGSIAEDMYLCRAAKLRNIPVRCVRGSGYRHRQGASFGGNRIDGRQLRTRYRRRYLSERNRIIVLAVCTPTWLAWPWLLLHAMALVIEGLLLSTAKLSIRPWYEIYWSAIQGAWCGRDNILKGRQVLQCTRICGLRDYLHDFTPTPHKVRMLWRYGLPRIEG